MNARSIAGKLLNEIRGIRGVSLFTRDGCLPVFAARQHLMRSAIGINPASKFSQFDVRLTSLSAALSNTVTRRSSDTASQTVVSGVVPLNYQFPNSDGRPAENKPSVIIIDPIIGRKLFELPGVSNVVDEFAPSDRTFIVPISEPSTTAIPVKRAISIITIRHKKMKKHKRRKLHKRMRFLKRKLEAAKRRKKEKIMLEYERAKAKWAEDFDANRSVEEQLVRGREAGWGIDILAERAARRKASSDSAVDNKS